MGRIRAVCFDLYETLVSEYSEGSRKVSRAAVDYGELIGLSNSRFREEWNERQHRRMTGQLADYPSVMKEILKKHQLRADEAVIEQLYRDRIREKSVPFEDIPQDIIGLLARLKEEGFKLGLISNCTEEEVQAWSTCPLTPFFDTVLFSYQAGYAKPDRRIYELACSRLGTEAEATAFIGDGGSHELDGAKEAGMQVFHAVWYIPESISGKITGYTKLTKPEQLLEELQLGKMH